MNWNQKMESLNKIRKNRSQINVVWSLAALEIMRLFTYMDEAQQSEAFGFTYSLAANNYAVKLFDHLNAKARDGSEAIQKQAGAVMFLFLEKAQGLDALKVRNLYLSITNTNKKKTAKGRKHGRNRLLTLDARQRKVI